MTKERSALSQTDGRLPLHARVKDDLLRRIRAGAWRPGEPLPAEPALAAEYDISLGTLRRVLAELASEGLLDRRQGRGTTVRRASFHDSLFRFFRLGDGGEARVPESRIIGRDIEAAPDDVASALLVDDGADVVHVHRVRSIDGRPLLVEDIWLPLPRFAPFAQAALDTLGPLLYPEYERLLGVVIGSAKEQLSVTSADVATADLLGCEEGSPVVQIERTALTHADETVEFRRSHGRADAFHYQVEIR